MRKITSTLFTALDGVVGGDMESWHFPYFNEELGASVDAVYKSADTLLFGRETYDSFAGAWPDRETAGGEDAPFAKAIGDMRKVVASNQQMTFTWRNSEQLQGNLVEGVAALKQEPGDADILIPGSISIVRQLLEAGLLDRLHLLVHPIAARKGPRLFDEGESPYPFDLVSSQAFKTGLVELVYAYANVAPDGTYEDAVKALGKSQQ